LTKTKTKTDGQKKVRNTVMK